MQESGSKEVKLLDAEGDSIAVDTILNALISIDVFHSKIHGGDAFRAWHKVTGIANSATYDILFSVPAATYPHLRKAAIVTAGPFDADMYEDTTTSADGTEITTHNINRNSLTTAGMDIFYSPTVTDAGSQIDYCYLSGTKKEAGSSKDMVEETIFKPSTKYLCRFTNTSGGAADLIVHLAFYE